MAATPRDAAYPSTAYILSLIGGALIALYGVLETIFAAIYSSTLESIVPGATGIVVAYGLIGLILGVIIIVFSMRMKSDPSSAKTSGILVLVFSLIGLIGGGGFFIGTILALVGGIMAITWKAPEGARER